METFYLIIVFILFLLAVSDLIVGVSNDAVNFLNAAIGSKAGSFRLIMAIAAFGVIVGASFSSGMMEVARKGIFNPGEFYFSEIMIMFLAVMIADVIILDTFNTFGLPTSTTVSIVFELLGAAVGMAIIKLAMADETRTLSEFINSSKALAIITGILLSIVIAFNAGAIMQYITRVIFSFNYKRRLKWLGAIFGGFALTFITYFLLIKGAKGASFMSPDVIAWIGDNTLQIMLYSFIGWTIIFQVLYAIFRVNVFKVIVLVGTFALAMAFAGNDLVNFIGVPLAGYSSYLTFIETTGGNPGSFTMEALAGPLDTPTYFLLIAGLIMVVTLYLSRKARSVVQTTLDLSRQDEGDERFRSNKLSQFLVRFSVSAANLISKTVPRSAQNWIDNQFEPYEDQNIEDPPQAFDLVRAAVTLVVASALIAFGTSLTLPLSTTYVTFMVAMGTSLADKAWDRESAVYRITGVFTVIGGWFLTALSAFTLAFILIFIFHYGQMYGIVAMILVAAFMIYRTHILHKKTSAKTKEDKQDIQSFSDENILSKSTSIITNSLSKVLLEYKLTIKGLSEESIKDLKKARTSVKKVTQKIKYLKDHINIIVEKIRQEYLDSGYYYIQVLDYMREILHSIHFIIEPSILHIENNHKPLLKEQIAELEEINKCLHELFYHIMQSIDKEEYGDLKAILEKQSECLKRIDKIQRNQIKRVKEHVIGSRNTILYLTILQETKNLSLQVVNLYKSQRDFFAFKNGKTLN